MNVDYIRVKDGMRDEFEVKKRQPACPDSVDLGERFCGTECRDGLYRSIYL